MESTAIKIRVLMIGPGEQVIGGITTLVGTIVPPLQRHVELSYFPTVRRRPVNESGKISAQNVALAISQYTRLLYALLRFRPQIVHLHTSQGIAWFKDTLFILMSRAFRCRIVLHMHGGHFAELYGKSTRLIQSYTRRALNLASAIIEVSAERKRRLAYIVPIERIFTFRNCIDVDAACSHPSGYSAHGAKALFLGVVGPGKGTFDLLEAMGLLKASGCSLELWVAGHEEREGELTRTRAQLRKLDLEGACQLLGAVRGAQKEQLLREASLFVLPSYQEALPMSILEAMAAGLPIVATPVGGVPEVVRDGDNGFLVPPGDPAALAEKLAVLANDRHLCERMGRRSREIAERELDVKPYVLRLVELYESLVGH